MLFMVLGFILARFIYWIFCRVSFKAVKNFRPVCGNKKKGKVKIMTVLGSGGHTTELLMLLKDLNIKDSIKLVCVIAKTDHLSRKKTIYMYSKELGLSEKQTENLINFVDISRSREVGQSYLTSVFSSIKALSQSVRLVFSERPDLLIVNGPGTCIPICYSALLLEVSDSF
ncbi:hypothetical protein ACR3K2_19210 [Cryptosporidium serpentis]